MDSIIKYSGNTYQLIQVVLLIAVFQMNPTLQAETLNTDTQEQFYGSTSDRQKLMQLYHQLDSALKQDVFPECLKDSLFSENYRYSSLVSDVVYCLKYDLVSLLDSQQIKKILYLSNQSEFKHALEASNKKMKGCKYSFLELFQFRLIQLNYISKIDSVRQVHINSFKQINGNIWSNIDTGLYYIHSEKSIIDSNILTNWVYQFNSNGILRRCIINGIINKAKLDSASYEAYFYRFDEKRKACIIEKYDYYPIYSQPQELYYSLMKVKMGKEGFKFVKFKKGEEASSNTLYQLNWYYTKIKV